MTSEFDDEIMRTGAREARLWVVRLASGDMAEAEWVRFRIWLNAHPGYLKLFKRERAFWHNLEPLKEMFQNTEEDASSLPPEFLQDDLLPSGRAFAGHTASVRWIPRAVRNSTVGLLVASLVFFVVWAQLGWLGFADHRTDAGEQRQVVLPDGSTAYLNTASAINVQFNNDARRIELLKGEVFFDVKPDSQAPFRVSAGTGVVEAIGTSFAVHRNDQGLTATVIAGEVEVRAQPVSEPKSSRPVRLKSGQQIDYTPGSSTHLIRSINRDSALSWRHGKIIIDGLPFVEAIEQLDRYRPGHTLMFGQLSNQPVSGVFKVDQADGAMTALASTQGLSVLRLTDYLLIIR